jgi:hypothetical protein
MCAFLRPPSPNSHLSLTVTLIPKLRKHDLGNYPSYFVETRQGVYYKTVSRHDTDFFQQLNLTLKLKLGLVLLSFVVHSFALLSPAALNFVLLGDASLSLALLSLALLSFELPRCLDLVCLD